MTPAEIRSREKSIEIEAKWEYPDNDECRNAFIKGAEWADEYVFFDQQWQEPYEEPVAKNFQIIYYSEYFRTFEIDYGYNLVIAHGGEEMSWKNVVKKKKISKWAYADWLLPIEEADCFGEQEIKNAE